MLKEIEVKIISDSTKTTIFKFIQVFVVFKNFSEINNFSSYVTFVHFIHKSIDCFLYRGNIGL